MATKIPGRAKGKRDSDSRTESRTAEKRYGEPSGNDFGMRKSERKPSGGRAIRKTLAGTRWHEMAKVKSELKAMLPALSASEVTRFCR